MVECDYNVYFFYIPLLFDSKVVGYVFSELSIESKADKKEYESKLLDFGYTKTEIRKMLNGIKFFHKEAIRSKLRFLETILKSTVRSKILCGEIAEVNHLANENEKLRIKAEKKLKTLSTIFSISKIFNSSKKLEEVLQRVIDSVIRLLEVEICSIMLYDRDESILKIAAARGLSEDVIDSARVKVGEGISGHVARFKRSLLIPDISKDPRFSSNINKSEYKTRSALSVPILSEDELIGVINVNNKMDNSIFTSDDKEVLEAISDQTAIAVMNARHHEYFKKKLRELECLNDISNLVQSTLDLDKLLRVVMELITDLMGVENCSLLLMEESTKTLRIVIANGLDYDIIKNTEVKLGEGISGYVAQTGEPLLITNIDSEGRFIKRNSIEYSTRSALSVPLKVKQKVIGVVNVNNKKNGKPFTNSDLLLLQTLSSQISSAIENARLYNKMQQKIVEMTMLQNVGQVINSTLDLSEVLKLVLDQILNIFDADMGSLMLWDDKCECLRITEQRGLDTLYSSQISFKRGEGVAGKVFESGRGVLVENSLKDEIYKKFGDDSEKIEKTLMCVPIAIKGEVKGVLSCEKMLDHTGPFTKENLDLMTTISTQASVAIENANLYNDLLDLYLHTIQSLAAAIDAKDSYTHGHSRRVMYFSIAIAEAMGFSGDELNTLRHTALLHDVGKIGISESILQKPGKLTDEEFDNIRSHPVVGSHILESIDFLKDVRMQMKHHHEKYDGTGYPDGLKGEEIPLGARIIAVADTYDAMTSTRSYRKGLKHEVAVEEIKRCSGTQFDPKVVEAFLKVEDHIREAIEEDEDIEIPRFNPHKRTKMVM